MRDMTLEQWLRTGQDASTYFQRNRKTPMNLTGLFTHVIRQFYMTADNLYPGVLPWDPEDKCDQRTYIEGSNIWKDNKIDVRPAIIVDLGDLIFDANKYQGIDRRQYFDLMEGESHYERQGQSSVVFAHLGANSGVVLNYASNTYDLLDAFSHAIKKDYCFDIFELRSILKPRRRTAEPDDWQCLVQVDFQYKEGYSVKTEATKLKTISLTAVVNQSGTQNI